MLIEQAARSSRWRRVCPGAKAGFAVAGLIAALAAPTPPAALGVALVMVLASLLGAGIRPRLYLRVALPATGFLALSSLSLACSLAVDGEGRVVWQLAATAGPRIAELAARSLAALAALLFLVLSTPLAELIALLRRLRLPEILLDLMVLCYRMLFVFSAELQAMRTAQQARLGFVSPRRSLHTLGLLAGGLAAQVCERAHHLHQAAQARNGDGPLRFLPGHYPAARRELALATLAGGLLIALTRLGA